MTSPNRENLIEILRSFNPWWDLKKVPDYFLEKFKRNAFYRINDFLKESNLRRTIILSGLRRVGKTTILYQLIDKLLNDGVDPEKIIYISFDHPTLKDTDLGDLLNNYHDSVYSAKDVYYIFDEIQYARDWDRWLKVIYDQQPQTQIIATGSASPVLSKGHSESGVGRWISVQVPTLSFYEYCKLLEIDEPDVSDNLTISSFFKMSPYEIIKVRDQLRKLQKYFNEYLKVGGFPEMAAESNEFLAKQMIREDVINKVINSDLPQLYEIRNIRDLERVFRYICDVSSNIISFETISKEFTNASRSVVEKYIKYLESANLIKLSWPIDLEGKKILKAQPKVYLTDNSIGLAINMKKNENLTIEELGQIVETTIFNHLSSINFYNPLSLGYFRNTKTQKEIDIVIENNLKDYTLIEVKYRDQIRLPKSDAIHKYSDKVSYSIVITKNNEDFKIIEKENSKILFIPAHAFLYILGQAELKGYNGLF